MARDLDYLEITKKFYEGSSSSRDESLEAFLERWKHLHTKALTHLWEETKKEEGLSPSLFTLLSQRQKLISDFEAYMDTPTSHLGKKTFLELIRQHDDLLKEKLEAYKENLKNTLILAHRQRKMIGAYSQFY
jgi:hypothetical protein